MQDHVPSDLIPIYDGMIISFVNYELKFTLEEKTEDVIKMQQKYMNDFFQNIGQFETVEKINEFGPLTTEVVK